MGPTPPKTASPSAWQAGHLLAGPPVAAHTHSHTYRPCPCTPAHVRPCSQGMWSFPRQSTHTSHLPPQPEAVPGHAHRPVAPRHTHPTNPHTRPLTCPHACSHTHECADGTDPHFPTKILCRLTLSRRCTQMHATPVRTHARTHSPITLALQCTRGLTAVHTPISENRHLGL